MSEVDSETWIQNASQAMSMTEVIRISTWCKVAIINKHYPSMYKNSLIQCYGKYYEPNDDKPTD